MWTPAAASVVARLILHEGFADVSFRVGGRRGWKAIVLAVIFPIVIGLISYGTAWATGLVQFSPHPFHFITHYVPENASPVVTFVINLAAASTFMTVFSLGTAAGEEIGWRGFMLTRLIGAGVPNPILMSGLIWGLGARAAYSRWRIRGGSVADFIRAALHGRCHRFQLRVRAVATGNRQRLAGVRTARGLEQRHSSRV